MSPGRRPPYAKLPMAFAGQTGRPAINWCVRMPSAGGRIGGQFDAGPAKMAVYLGANYVHEFKGQDNVTFASGGQTLGACGMFRVHAFTRILCLAPFEQSWKYCEYLQNYRYLTFILHLCCIDCHISVINNYRIRRRCYENR